ncbi:MAG: hypothetical protein KAG18_07280 [Sinobacterium sp.]|nr:hypothetical protein [Sinobacterium sp.]
MVKRVTHKLEMKLRQSIELSTKRSEEISGFLCYEYSADWSDFPASLRVTALFSDELERQLAEDNFIQLQNIIVTSFMKYGVRFKDVRKSICLAVVSDN